jgi:hypothetical protein
VAAAELLAALRESAPDHHQAAPASATISVPTKARTTGFFMCEISRTTGATFSYLRPLLEQAWDAAVQKEFPLRASRWGHSQAPR